MSARDWKWQQWAACRGQDLRLFFGPGKESEDARRAREQKAKTICGGCSVRDACLDYALRKPERAGTWGGLSEDQRASLRRSKLRKGELSAPSDDAAQAVEKQCSLCRQTRPAGDFQKNRSRPDGLHAYCRPCTNEERQRRREKEAVA